ncbi:anti-sigma factor family protein [Haliangium sp.]
MPIRCEDIESLLQTHIDGELADDDAREVEAHLAACANCRQHAARERRFHHELRAALAPPPAPEGLRERMGHALDQEEWRMRGQARRSRWLLPAASSLAAAAALLLFAVSPLQAPEPPVADEAVLQHMRRPPIEVQGAAVSPWLQKYYRGRVDMPRFVGVSTELRGARLSQVRGRQAVQFYYDVALGGRQHEVSMQIFDATGFDFSRGFTGSRTSVVEGRPLSYGELRGYGVVAYGGPGGLGYLFTSAHLDGEHLLELVTRSNLLSQGGAR